MNTPTTTTSRDRLARWQAIHKQLLNGDTQYRKRQTSFIVTLSFLACLMLPFYLPFFGIRLFGFATDVVVVCCLAAAMVILALRQFLFQNQRIQNYLKVNHDA